jgi:type III pantothenate kinase
MVDSMVQRIRAELGEQARVIATGGLAQLIASETASIERVEPFLTLQGLRLLFAKNRPEREGARKEKVRDG